MRGATAPQTTPQNEDEISIHAPHAGSDLFPTRSIAFARGDFNPRSPCGERRSYRTFPAAAARFQSTLPMRGATTLPAWLNAAALISIHAPHAGSDQLPEQSDIQQSLFQSTLPMRGATRSSTISQTEASISIHAPHAGSDVRKTRRIFEVVQFQSTLPMRGATCQSPLRRIS